MIVTRAFVCLVLIVASTIAAEEDADDSFKFDLPGGVRMRVESVGNDSVVKFNLDPSEARGGSGVGGGHGGVGGGHGGGGGGGGGGHNKKLLQRILPMFILPFLIQSAIVPMFLTTLKMMLVKSLLVGKLALLLIAINALKNSNAFKSRSVERLADVHYGYQHGGAGEEIGAYMSRLGLR